MDGEAKPVTLYQGDCVEVLKSLPSQSVHCVVTSPPYYGLRDYGVEGQIGLEETPQRYVERMVEVFTAVRRVLRYDGTLWLNLGDSYGDEKQLRGMPWRVAFALQSSGWHLRQDIVWAKPNPMPESVRDRCTKAHEYLFLLSKSPTYYFDAEAMKEAAVEAGRTTTSKKYTKTNESEAAANIGKAHQGNLSGVVAEKRNRRSVWTIPPKPFKGAHFAVMPPELIRPCVRAGSSEHGCCSLCESPLKRITERTRTATRPGADTKVTGDPLVDGNRDPQRHVTTTTTVGWEPQCKCGVATVPCRVLDPFAGAGTTSLVAVEEGRRGIGIELNPAYCEIAVNRIGKEKVEWIAPSSSDQLSTGGVGGAVSV